MQEQSKYIKFLPHLLSFVGLLFGIVSIYLVAEKYFFLAILVFLIAFIFDITDGWIARYFKLESKWGVCIDSSVDIVTYVFFSAILVFFGFPEFLFLRALTCLVILLFGTIRLVRFIKVGIQEDSHGKYYEGVTVVHLTFVTITLYYLLLYFRNLAAISLVLILVLSPFLLSKFKIYKPAQPIGLLILASCYAVLTLIHLWK